MPWKTFRSMHYSDVIMIALDIASVQRYIMSTMASQITDVSIVYSTICLGAGQRKPRHWSFWGKFTGDRWIPHPQGPWRGKCFHLMTSSWGDHKESKSLGTVLENKISFSSVNSLAKIDGYAIRKKRSEFYMSYMKNIVVNLGVWVFLQ